MATQQSRFNKTPDSGSVSSRSLTSFEMTGRLNYCLSSKARNLSARESSAYSVGCAERGAPLITFSGDFRIQQLERFSVDEIQNIFDGEIVASGKYFFRGVAAVRHQDRIIEATQRMVHRQGL